jgi:hypothetical protein
VQRCTQFGAEPVYAIGTLYSPALRTRVEEYCTNGSHCQESGGFRTARYFTACGLIGEPTAPVIGSGGPQKRNS